MADREIMDAQEQENVYRGDGAGETMIGAGHVGIIAQAFEARH